jgi:hypothetical protein
MITWPLPALTSFTGPISPLPHITSSLLVLRCRSRKLDFSLEPLLRAIDDDAFNAVLPLHPQLTTSCFCIAVFSRQSNQFGQVSGTREWGKWSRYLFVLCDSDWVHDRFDDEPKGMSFDTFSRPHLTPNNLIAQQSGSRNRNYRNDDYSRDSPEAEP